MLTRRTVLLGGAAALSGAVAACGPTTTGVRPELPTGTPTSGPTTVPTPVDPTQVEPGPVVYGQFRSRRRRGKRTRWAVARPPGVAGALPLVVALHGYDGDVTSIMGAGIDIPRQVAALVASGVPPFAVVAVDGGNGFWHERTSGEDAGAMVLEELLPLLARRTDLGVLAGEDDRIGMLGWSMGGFGVLRLAPILGPDRVAAVCATCPGLYTDLTALPPEGFTDVAEYEEYSVLDRQRDLDGLPVRIACGFDDYFYDAVQDYVAGFPDDADLEVSFTEGSHDLAYIRRSLPGDLGFVASRLG